MCMFSGAVQAVAGTSIFVRRASRTGQVLVYSMNYQADAELAMILPLPSLGTGEEAVTFIDLSGYPSFFEDMEAVFLSLSFGRSRAIAAEPLLKVHAVGSFEASWVPTLADFSRLDPRFRLPTEIWEQLPQYADYGFAVFKLKAGEKKIHPMAFEFQTRESHRLFFPTVHVHEGVVESVAHFDHALYCQSESPEAGWRSSEMPAGHFLKIDQSKGLLLADQKIFKKSVLGPKKNEDLWITG